MVVHCGAQDFLCSFLADDKLVEMVLEHLRRYTRRSNVTRSAQRASCWLAGIIESAEGLTPKIRTIELAGAASRRGCRQVGTGYGIYGEVGPAQTWWYCSGDWPLWSLHIEVDVIEAGVTSQGNEPVNGLGRMGRLRSSPNPAMPSPHVRIRISSAGMGCGLV